MVLDPFYNSSNNAIAFKFAGAACGFNNRVFGGHRVKKVEQH